MQIFSIAIDKLHQFFTHCPSYVALQKKNCALGTRSSSMRNSDPLRYQIHRICDVDSTFLCNFYPHSLQFCTKNRAKNAMNNFKVRVIKQQWGIIKHQLYPPTLNRHIKSIAIFSSLLDNFKIDAFFSCAILNRQKSLF